MADFNASETFDWLRGCGADFGIASGQYDAVPMQKRCLSEMRDMYCDVEALEAQLARGDRIVYEFHALELPFTAGDLSFGLTVLYSGKVGDEYLFTKGHFHQVTDTAEVYYCIRGRGYLLLENKAGDWLAVEMYPGRVCYAPKGYAHRSVNTDPEEPLVAFFVYRADAGHDYATIESRGFRKLIVERDGAPAIIDNPRWK